MRKALAGLGLAVCLGLAPTSAAIAAAQPAPAVVSQPGPDRYDDDGGGGAGLWGLFGLLGLLGLAGLKKLGGSRRDHVGTSDRMRHDRP